MNADLLRLHQFVSSSRANGPGRRAVIWVQGCSLGCPGCFNPQTHSTEAGEIVSVDDLFHQVAAVQPELEGVTISGGEPLQQFPAVLALLDRIRRETNLTSIVFTGFTWEEVKRIPASKELPACLDVLIAGRYEAGQRLAQGLVSSANQTVHCFSSRYTPADLLVTPPAEAWITSTGELLLSGIDPLRWV